MRKEVFYPREKLLSTDLNQSITDVDYFVRETSLNTVIDNPLAPNRNIILNGLTGTATAPPSDSVIVLAGLAYHGGTIAAPDFGRMVTVPTNVTLVWDGTDAPGFPVDHDHRRIDIVCVKHIPTNTAAVARYFIDSNPASPTFGQQIVNSVVTQQTDGYSFYIRTGTPAVAPAIPAVPAGYIPLFLVYVHSFNETGGVLEFRTAGTIAHAGAWRPNFDSDIDNYYFQDQNKLTLSELEDKVFSIPVKENFGASPARPSVVITPDWSTGYVQLNDIVDVVTAEFIGPANFVGVGLNDMTSSGIYTGTGTIYYRVQIDGVNTFRWSDTGGAVWNASGVAITGGIAQLLNNGVYITFAVTPGHTVNDYWDFYATDYDGQPVYGADNTAPAVIENLIFGIITSVTPGAVTVTFHRGDPGIPSPTLSNCDIPIEVTYPHHVKLKDLPATVFRNEFQTGLTVDINLEKRIEDLESGVALDPLYLRRDISAPASNTLDRQVPVRSDLFTIPNSAPFVVTTTGPGVATVVCTELNADRLDSLHIAQSGGSYIPYLDSSNYMQLLTSGSRIGIGVAPSYALDIETNRAINIRGASGYLYVNNISPNTGGTISITDTASIGTRIITPAFRMPTGASAGYTMTCDASGNASWSITGLTPVHDHSSVSTGGTTLLPAYIEMGAAGLSGTRLNIRGIPAAGPGLNVTASFSSENNTGSVSGQTFTSYVSGNSSTWLYAIRAYGSNSGSGKTMGITSDLTGDGAAAYLSNPTGGSNYIYLSYYAMANLFGTNIGKGSIGIDSDRYPVCSVTPTTNTLDYDSGVLTVPNVDCWQLSANTIIPSLSVIGTMDDHIDSRSLYAYHFNHYMYDRIVITFGSVAPAADDWPASGTITLYPGMGYVEYNEVRNRVGTLIIANGTATWNPQGTISEQVGIASYTIRTPSHILHIPSDDNHNWIYFSLINCNLVCSPTTQETYAKFTCTGYILMYQDYSSSSIGTGFTVQVQFYF